MMINSKYKIVLSLSLALALFYSLPWIALSEQARLANNGLPGGLAAVRVAYLFVTVFLTSVLFLHYNFYWKHKLLGKMAKRSRTLLNVFMNIVLVIIACTILMVVADRMFAFGGGRALFIFYLFRNAGIALIIMLVTYVVELVDTLRHDRIRMLTLQHQHAETELASLRAQIDPHFLFNSLASLSGLIRSNSREALEFVDHLSETFRYILEKREHKVVTVKDELQFLQSYVFMLKRRFADGFQVSTKIDEAHLLKNIPQFALQITVENAIKHNVVSVQTPLTVEVSSNGNTLRVSNNLQKKKSMPGYGIGLANLSKRYQIIGNKDITIRKDEHQFVIDLPLL